VGHAVALVATVCHTCVDVCDTVSLCAMLCCAVYCCVDVFCTAVLMCIYVFLLVRVCIFGNLFGISTNEAQFSWLF